MDAGIVNRVSRILANPTRHPAEEFHGLILDRSADPVPTLVGSIELTVSRSEFTIDGSRRISKLVALG